MSKIFSLSLPLGYINTVRLEGREYFVAVNYQGEIIDGKLHITRKNAKFALSDYHAIPLKFIGEDE